MSSPLSHNLENLLLSISYPRLAFVRARHGLSLRTLVGLESTRAKGHFSDVTHIIDAGAHEGSFAKACSIILPRAKILCFEPAPDTFSRLKKNISGWPNIKPFNAALGSKEGTMSLYVGDLDQANSLLPMTANHIEAWKSSRPKGKTDVTVKTIDQVCKDEVSNGIVFLKADVQGFELELLRGASKTLKMTKVLQLELSFVPLYQGSPAYSDMWQFVENAGFRLLEIGSTISSPRNGLPMQADFLFIKRE